MSDNFRLKTFLTTVFQYFQDTFLIFNITTRHSISREKHYVYFVALMFFFLIFHIHFTHIFFLKIFLFLFFIFKENKIKEKSRMTEECQNENLLLATSIL